MSASIKINGVEWAAHVSELGTEIKDHKMHRPNIKGDLLVIPSRTAVGAYKVQLTFPYVTAAQMQELKALYTTQTPVTITHSMDFPQGSYVPTEFAQTRLPSLSNVIYTIMMTFCMDFVQTLPVPDAGTSLSAGGITQKLGM